MSATGRPKRDGSKTERSRLDFYATPEWATKAICPILRITEKSVVLDPCCGTGDILRVISPRPAILAGFELDQERAIQARSCCPGMSLSLVRDSLGPEEWRVPRADRITHVVTNPPYSLAVQFATRAIGEVMAKGGVVAMLLRLNWMAGKNRVRFHKTYPSDIYVLSKRPSFRPDGKTDATEYGWFVWHHGANYRWSVLEIPKLTRRASQCHPK